MNKFELELEKWHLETLIYELTKNPLSKIMIKENPNLENNPKFRKMVEEQEQLEQNAIKIFKDLLEELNQNLNA